MEDELLAELEAEENLRKPYVTFKEYGFDVTDEEAAELEKDNQKQWTIVQGVLAKRGAVDLDFHGGTIRFCLALSNEYLLGEITDGINEQLDEITGRRVKETELWGAF